MKNYCDKLVILGNGTFAKEVTDLLDGQYDILGYCANIGNSTIDLSVIPFEVNLICAITSVKRKNYIESIKHNNYVNVICGNHSKDVVFGVGNIVCRNTTISRGTKIGNHVIINRGVTIGHNVIIDDYVTIGPGVNIAGEVTIGESSFIGMGSNIRENVKIGNNVVIGAMSLVLNNIPDNWIVYGIPVRFKEFNDVE